MAGSKALGHWDESGFEFAQEMLAGDETAAINFDRLQRHPEQGYLIFEYLRCGPEQTTVTPWTSHPKYYWHKNKRKFLALWRVAQDLGGTLYLVNYAAKGDPNDDQIRVIRVEEMDEEGIRKETDWKTDRAQFSAWFRKRNRECLKES